jgi:predicted RNA-binding protein YlqC (UPF0109 family)
MATIDEQFIEYIVKQLVNDPDAVKIERTVDEKGVLLSLTVSAEDIGRVIGKRGATAQSLRNLLRALGSKNDARYNLKIIDVDKPEGERNPAPVEQSEGTESTESVDTVAEVEPEAIPESEEIVEAVEETTPESVENSSDLAEKTRKELADLDDLDI